MTPGQVAKIVGCHPGTIRGHIRSGSLPADRRPVERDRYHIHRDALVKWLVAAGWSGSQIRKAMPMPGPLCLVGVRPEMMDVFRTLRPHLYAETMFRAAVDLLEYQPWGIVFDLPALGTKTVCREALWYRLYTDRPLLIALHADDFDTRASVFDFTIPDSLPPGKIAQRVRGLRPWSGR